MKVHLGSMRTRAHSGLFVLVVVIQWSVSYGADGSWITLAPMTDPRQEVGTAASNGKIYVVGGLPRTNLVQEYDPQSDTWRFLSPLPIAVDHTAVVPINGKLYVVGGNTNQGSSNALFEYDPDADQWVQRASMPTARTSLAAVVITGKIYAVGGAGATQRELEVYDPASDTWAQLTPMPTGRNHLAAGAIGGRIYVAGGRPGNLTTLEIYDPATDSWSAGSEMITGRSGHAAAVVDEMLYTFGGEGNANSPIGIFQEVEVYDPQTDSWKSLNPMPTPRHGIGAAALGNRIYVPAGATQAGGGTQTGRNEAFVIQPEKLFFAHFASGNGIGTDTIVGSLTEIGDSLVTVEVFQQDGNPLNADLGGIFRSKVTFQIAPLGAFTLRSADQADIVRIGSLVVSSEHPVTGTILFSSILEEFRGLAAVGVSDPVTRFFVPVQRDPANQISSGLAIANITGSAVTVTLVLRDEAGSILGEVTLELSPRGQTSRFLFEFFPDSDIDGPSFRGAVTATSTGQIVALALLFTSEEFATLPVTGF